MSQHHTKNKPQSFYRTKGKTLDALGKLLRSVQTTMDDIGTHPDQLTVIHMMQNACQQFIQQSNTVIQEEGLCPKTPSNS